ncbi:MAG: hypothetical protein ABI597_03150 [Gammaproteobacteria bacterium]
MFSKPKYYHRPEVTKTPISIGQALLILIDAEQQFVARKGVNTSDKLRTLEILYLTGAKTPDRQEYIFSLINQPKLAGLFKHYILPDEDAELIDLAHSANEDKSRRYFETHLAYRTLEQKLDQFSYEDISLHYHECVSRIPEDSMQRLNSRVLDEEKGKKPKDGFEWATYETLIRLKSSSYLCETVTGKSILGSQYSIKATTKSFTPPQRIKIQYLTKLVLASLKLISLNNHNYPLKVYSDPDSLFSDQKRGRKKKDNFGTTTSTAGILKNCMTVPTTDIAYLEEFNKPEDANQLLPDINYFLRLVSKWTKHSADDQNELEEARKQAKVMKTCTYQVLSVINKHIALFRKQTEFFVKLILRKAESNRLLYDKKKVFQDLDLLLSRMRRMVFFTFPNETNYDIDSEWQEINFSRLVHPHVNSISGILLTQLRIILQMESEKCSVFKTVGKMKLFFQCYLSSLLYTRGGHSLNEFSSVFEVPEVSAHFGDGFTLNSLFYEDNQTAFQAALTSTIEYNRRDLLQARVNQAIVFRGPLDDKPEVPMSKPKHMIMKSPSQ